MKKFRLLSRIFLVIGMIAFALNAVYLCYGVSHPELPVPFGIELKTAHFIYKSYAIGTALLFVLALIFKIISVRLKKK